jgi:enamine deaminase RidA (YjgF/YER057c/UK114 family)
MTKFTRVATNNPAEAANGYSRLLQVDRWIYSSITNGKNHTAGTIPEDVVEQVKQAFRNLEDALAPLGASVEDTVRIDVWCADQADGKIVWKTIDECLNHAKPAAYITFGPLPGGLKAEIGVVIYTRDRDSAVDETIRVTHRA